MTRIFNYIGKGLAFLFFLILLYFLIAGIGSILTVNKDRVLPREGIEIFLRTNGVHTSFTLPVKNEVFNWTKIVDPLHTLSQGEGYQYVSFGWGDLEFYQTTPNWSDLTFTTAFRALFLRTPSALNVEFHKDLIEDDTTVSIILTEQQYKKLVSFIEDSFETNLNGDPKPIPELHYNRNDVFYRAKRSLNIFYTCNTWTNNGLKNSGLKACLWTPFDKGIFYHYR